jgi:hypothetical protein
MNPGNMAFAAGAQIRCARSFADGMNRAQHVCAPASETAFRSSR